MYPKVIIITTFKGLGKLALFLLMALKWVPFKISNSIQRKDLPYKVAFYPIYAILREDESADTSKYKINYLVHEVDIDNYDNRLTSLPCGKDLFINHKQILLTEYLMEFSVIYCGIWSSIWICLCTCLFLCLSVWQSVNIIFCMSKNVCVQAGTQNQGLSQRPVYPSFGWVIPFVDG